MAEGRLGGWHAGRVYGWQTAGLEAGMLTGYQDGRRQAWRMACWQGVRMADGRLGGWHAGRVSGRPMTGRHIILKARRIWSCRQVSLVNRWDQEKADRSILRQAGSNRDAKKEVEQLP
jgi:hypothetical protein